jgi:hypothetical protein
MDIEYTESDSDLGDDEERILMHGDLNIPSDNDEDEKDMDDDDDDDDDDTQMEIESLRTCSTLFTTQSSAEGLDEAY